MNTALTNANSGAESQQPRGCAPRTLDVRIVDAVDPAGVEVEEVEDDVADVRHGEDEEEARRVGAGDRQHDQVDARDRSTSRASERHAR